MSANHWFRKWYPHYEGDGEGEGEGDKGGEGNKGGDPNLDEKKFTQKDLDKAINHRFKKEKTEKEQLLQKLQAITQAGLTPEAKQALEDQITSLQESMQTKEQTLQQKMAESDKKYNKQIETLTGERDAWRNRYDKSMVDRAILDAAVASEAEDPTQFVLMFGPMSRNVEEIDNAGKGTGRFVPRMKFTGVDADKKSVELDLPIGEAIAHMVENGLHKNLFKHKANPGTGKPTDGTKGGGNNNGDKMPERSSFQTDDEYAVAYQGWRNTHNVDGTPLQKA